MAFADIMKTNTRLAHLDLADNLLGENSIEIGTALAKAILFNASIKHLDLSRNRFGPDFGRQLAATLIENRTLTAVDVENNRFDSTVGLAMVEMLKVNTSLLVLRISGTCAGKISGSACGDLVGADDEITCGCGPADVEIGVDHYRLIRNILSERNGD